MRKRRVLPLCTIRLLLGGGEVEQQARRQRHDLLCMRALFIVVGEGRRAYHRGQDLTLSL